MPVNKHYVSITQEIPQRNSNDLYIMMKILQKLYVLGSLNRFFFCKEGSLYVLQTKRYLNQ